MSKNNLLKVSRSSNVHRNIKDRGFVEQFFNMFEKRENKQTKGLLKHNAKRKGIHPSGLHPDYTKRKKRTGYET